MENLYKSFGIIAFAAVIALVFTACSNGEDNTVKPDGEYEITVNQPVTGGGFKVKAGSGPVLAVSTRAKAGISVTLTAAPGAGYIFDSFDITGASLNNGSGNIRNFTMPSNDVTVSAVFNEDTNLYSITVNQPVIGGSFTVKAGVETPGSGNTEVRAGTLITLEAAPDANWNFLKYTITGTTPKSGSGGKRTFIMPNKPVTVTAEFILAVQDKRSDFHIYLCFGQSNMQGGPGTGDRQSAYWDWNDARFQFYNTYNANGGRGRWQWNVAKPPLARMDALTPADFFGRYMVENTDPDIKIGVMMVAVSSLSLNCWHPDPEKYTKSLYVRNAIAGDTSSGDAATRWITGLILELAPDGLLFNEMVRLGHVAMDEGVLKGIIMHQGEGGTGVPNTPADGWPLMLKEIYDALLESWGMVPGDIPLVAGETFTGETEWDIGKYKILDLNKYYPGKFYAVEAAGLERYPGDQYHFNVASKKTLGERYADKILELLYK